MIADKAYLALRNKLNCLHYCQPLSKESCALAERLLGDVLATTELYHITKKRAEAAEAQASKERIALVPLQKENARLVKENNTLHKEIITAKENLSLNDNNWKRQVQQLESEYSDIKQACSQKDYKLKQLEKRSLRLEERLNKLMSDSGAFSGEAVQVQAISMAPAEDEETNQRILQLLHQHTNRMVESQEEQSLIEQMIQADERLQVMTKELGMHKEFKEAAEDRIKELESMIGERDRELARLGNLYIPSENLDKMNIEFTEKANGATISKLNAQLDYINKENNRLQSIINDLKIKNNGNTGMYLENRKVYDKVQKLQKVNDDLRRRCERDENELAQWRQREQELSQIQVVEREKYESALQTIKCQQQDITKFKKYFEIKDNQERLMSRQQIGSQDELDHEPQRQTVSASDFARLKHDNERYAKKHEQFRGELSVLGDTYLETKKNYDSAVEELKLVQVRFNDMEHSNRVLRQELERKDQEIDIMLQFLKQNQPVKGKENEPFANGEQMMKPSKDNSGIQDPDKTKMLFS